jgi:hypothetical protein
VGVIPPPHPPTLFPPLPYFSPLFPLPSALYFGSSSLFLFSSYLTSIRSFLSLALLLPFPFVPPSLSHSPPWFAFFSKLPLCPHPPTPNFSRRVALSTLCVCVMYACIYLFQGNTALLAPAVMINLTRRRERNCRGRDFTGSPTVALFYYKRIWNTFSDFFPQPGDFCKISLLEHQSWDGGGSISPICTLFTLKRRVRAERLKPTSLYYHISLVPSSPVSSIWAPPPPPPHANKKKLFF